MNANQNNTHNRGGLHYFTEGWRLMLHSGLKRYVFLPILVNILIIGGAFYGIYTQLSSWMTWVMSYVPSWLQWLSYLIWPIALLSIVVFFGYFFSTLANIIAAPFNSMLAAKVEIMLTGHTPSDDSWMSLAKDVGRALQREMQNLAYYLPRLIGILLLFLVPVIGTFIAPIVLFAFNAWMMAIQYNDYSFDNNKVSFPTMRARLMQDRTDNFIFGALVNLVTMIPIINLFIMPAAVCGGTLQWVEKYRRDFVK